MSLPAFVCPWIRVCVCVCVCARARVRQPRVCQRHNSSPVQAWWSVVFIIWFNRYNVFLYMQCVIGVNFVSMPPATMGRLFVAMNMNVIIARKLVTCRHIFFSVRDATVLCYLCKYFLVSHSSIALTLKTGDKREYDSLCLFNCRFIVNICMANIPMFADLLALWSPLYVVYSSQVILSV